MEALLVYRVDRHVRTAEQTGVIKSADLHDHRRKSWRARCDVRTAVGAEFACGRAFQIATGRFFPRSSRRRVTEAISSLAGDTLAIKRRVAAICDSVSYPDREARSLDKGGDLYSTLGLVPAEE